MNKEVIKFEKPACNPCVLVSNKLNELGVEYRVVNAYEDRKTAKEYGVLQVPVTIYLEDGVEKKRSFGYNVPELEEIAELAK